MIDDSKATANRKARDDRKKAHLRDIMDHYTEQFRAATSQDAFMVAREVHATIELVLERDRKKSEASRGIRCGKGCSHCCHGPVEIWPQEALLLVEAARAAGIEIDPVRLERQSRYGIDAWQQQPAADRACVFLGDGGACRIYDARPNACRKLLVTSDPVLCDRTKATADKVERWFSWEAEILESAAQEVFGAGLMPGLLLAQLRKS